MKSWIIWLVLIVGGSFIYSALTSANRNDTGAIVGSGTVSAFEIQVGDCLTDTIDGSGFFSEADAVPCDQAHMYEAFHNEDLPGDTFPSDMETEAHDVCDSAFPSFVGASVENTDLTYMFVFPTQESWDSKGDRQVTCLVGMGDGSDIYGTLRNSR